MTLRLTPSQVLDMHTDLLIRMDDSLFTEVIRTSWTSDFDAALERDSRFKQATGARIVRDSDTYRRVEENAHYLQTTHYNHVRQAETYHVTEQMTDLVAQIAEETDASDTWQHRLAPSTCGIARFDKPIEITELRGRTMKAHWVIWGPAMASREDGSAQPVTLMTWYNDRHDPDEVELPWADVDRAIGRWAWIGGQYLQDDTPLGTIWSEVPESVRQEIIEEGDTPVEQTTHLPKYLYALWLLLGQTIVSATPTAPDRAAGRRAIRKALPPRVTVITLRRREHRPSEGESHVEWHHQWIVRQHPRWQPRGPRVCHGAEGGEHRYGPVEAEPGLIVRRCARDGCEAYLARIIVNAHVKGPEGMPLLQSRKIYDLRE